MLRSKVSFPTASYTTLEPGAVGGVGDFRGEILLGVQDYVIRPGSPGKLRLGLGGDGGVNVGAESLAHLDEQEADSAGPGMDQHAVAVLDAVRVVAQVVGGHSLEHSGRAVAGRQPLRHPDQAPRGDQGLLRVGTGVTAIRDGIPNGDVGHS